MSANKGTKRMDTHKNSEFLIWSVKSRPSCTPSSAQNNGNNTSGMSFIISISGMGLTSKLNWDRLAAASGLPVIYKYDRKKIWKRLLCECILQSHGDRNLPLQTSNKCHASPYLDWVPIRCPPTISDQPNRNAATTWTLVSQHTCTNQSCPWAGTRPRPGKSTAWCSHLRQNRPRTMPPECRYIWLSCGRWWPATDKCSARRRQELGVSKHLARSVRCQF